MWALFARNRADSKENNVKLAFLKELFAGFLRTRAPSAATSAPLLLLDSVAGTGVSREVPATLSHELIAAAKSDADALLKQLESHAHGLRRSPARPAPRAVRAERGRAREAAALVAAPVALLPDSLQSAAHCAGGDLIRDRGHEGHHRHRLDGGAVDDDPFLAGEPVQPGRRELKAMVSNTATVIRRDLART